MNFWEKINILKILAKITNQHFLWKPFFLAQSPTETTHLKWGFPFARRSKPFGSSSQGKHSLIATMFFMAHILSILLYSFFEHTHYPTISLP